MATVYLAQDLKHDRKVALKVLRPELAAVIGAERFLAEIKTTANLQHPHILPLHDSGEVDGTVFYVMPYVEGETVRDRLTREGQLPVADAVQLAREVAGALDYAHRRGVVHRDIKPENILLHEGQALVADFGIALAVSRSDGATRMTETGLSLGTPHYMSPEQAMGERTVDARTDIYALGCVLYETLTGEPPFTGPSAQAIVARVLAAAPAAVTALRQTVPAHVAAAIHTAIQKLPADRFPTAAAFAEALGNTGYTTAAAVPGSVTSAKGWRQNRPALALGGLAAVAMVLALWGWFRPEPPAEPVVLDLDLGGITVQNHSDVVISPDGSMLAIGGVRDGLQAIWLRRIGEPDFQKVLGTDNGQRPSFSPDNQWLVFRRNDDNTLVKVAVTGGGAMTLVSLEGIFPLESHWGTQEWIIFVAGGGEVYRVPAAGGPAEPLPGTGGRQPFLLPDGSGVLHAMGGSVSLFSFATDSSTVLVPEARHPFYVETGHLLYVAEDGGVFAVPFDLGAHRITGPAVRVLDRVAGNNARRGYSVARNGTLVHYEGDIDGALGAGSGPRNALVLFDLTGRGDTVPLPPGRRQSPSVAPNGRVIAFEQVDPGRTGATDIFTFDLVTGTTTQITFDGDNDHPIWSPDGTRLLFDRDTVPTAEDLFTKRADNSGPMERVLSLPDNQNPTGWLEDGTVLLESFRSGASADLLTYAIDAQGEAKPWLNAPWNERQLAVSPDRTLAAYVANETGAEEVWLRTWPVPEGKWRVSSGGGFLPRWSPDGRVIYFWRVEEPMSTLYRVQVDRTPGIVVRAPEAVLTLALDGRTGWALHPDGERFIAVVPAPAPAAAPGPAADDTRHLVVLNWFTALEALTGRARP